MSSAHGNLDIFFSEHAKAQLTREGFTVDYLISNYPHELKRFALSCDLGLTGIGLDPPGAHESSLVPAANYVISQATKIDKSIECIGIALPVLFECYERMAIEYKYGINSVPRALINTSLCLKVLPQNGYTMRLIPEAEQSKEMALIAVREDGRSIEWVSKRLIDLALCIAAVSTTGLALRCIPEHLKTREVCLAAVSVSGSVLANVPLEHRDYDLCWAAVMATGMAYQHVPTKLKSEALLCQAVKTAGWLLQEEGSAITPLVCKQAVLSDPSNLRMVPAHLCSLELCLDAVSLDGTTLSFVPKEHRTDNLITTAIKKSPQCIDCLTLDEKNEERQRMAYFLDPDGVSDLIAYPLIHELHQEHMRKNNTNESVQYP
jgi:hypothetical protein